VSLKKVLLLYCDSNTIVYICIVDKKAAIVPNRTIIIVFMLFAMGVASVGAVADWKAEGQTWLVEWSSEGDPSQADSPEEATDSIDNSWGDNEHFVEPETISLLTLSIKSSFHHGHKTLLSGSSNPPFSPPEFC